MKVSQDGMDFIKEHEGLRLDVYNDVAAYPTIGYGHKIQPHESYKHISTAEAHDLLVHDVGIIVGHLNSLDLTFTQSEYDAVVDLIYNIGWGAFYHSTMLQLLKQGNMSKASLQFDKWVYSGGVKVDALISRRKGERALFEKGIYKG